jgi:hypothetical protein
MWWTLRRVGLAVLIAGAVGLSTAILAVMLEGSVHEAADTILVVVLIALIVGYAIVPTPTDDK